MSMDPTSGGGPVTRRDVLRWGTSGAAGLALAGGLAPWSAAAAEGKPLARSVIQIWLWGGASHIDTFDPKPAAGSDFSGPLDKSIETNVSGVRIGQLLPLLAKQADKYALVRGMTHGVNAHETASYMVQTGRAQGGREVYPCVGAVVSLFKGAEAGYKGLLPPYIVLTEPQGRFSEAGFLGTRFKPFATGGDPGAARFAVEGIVSTSVTEDHQKRRRDLLGRLNTLANVLDDDPRLAAARQAEVQAYDLILGDAGKVFDLSQEKAETRDAYGRTTFGQSCLVARRLVEQGVPHVTINYKGWDTHKQHFQTMNRKLPELDKGLSTLLQDLADRRLLEGTIVWCGGEFGRTPKVQWEAPWNGGRGHHGKVFSVLLAGGGFKGGLVVGSSDAHGQEVRDRPVYPTDLIGAIYERLGIDPQARLPHPQGLVTRVMPSTGDESPTGGRLVELL